MRKWPWEIVDGDGHIREYDAEILEFLEEPYRSADSTLNYPFFPTLDGFHRGAHGARRGTRQGRINAESVIEFMDSSGIEAAVLFPTAGLGVGMIQDRDWAVAICRGYNNWFHERYRKVSPRMRGVALLPLQDVDEAIKELRRAVSELGAVVGMLPANSADMGVRRPLGDKSFWPLYAEAQRLGCPLAVHGAPSIGLGINFLTQLPHANLLEHPVAQLIQFTSMMLSGMFDEFKDLRVAYLEADTGWVPYMVDRLLPKTDPAITNASDIIKSGRVYFSVEADEQSLQYFIERFGDESVMYASDYPHITTDGVTEEIEEFVGRTDIPESSLPKIFKENAVRFYQLDQVLSASKA